MARIAFRFLSVTLFLVLVSSNPLQKQKPSSWPSDGSGIDYTGTTWQATGSGPTSYQSATATPWQNYTSNALPSSTMSAESTSCVPSKEQVTYITETIAISFTTTETITGTFDQARTITLPPILESPPPFCSVTQSGGGGIQTQVSSRISSFESKTATSTVQVIAKTTVVIYVPASTPNFHETYTLIPAPTDGRAIVIPTTAVTTSSLFMNPESSFQEGPGKARTEISRDPNTFVRPTDLPPIPGNQDSTGDGDEGSASQDSVRSFHPGPAGGVNFAPLTKTPPSHTVINSTPVSAAPTYVEIGTQTVQNAASTAFMTTIDGSVFEILPHNGGVVLPDGTRLVSSDDALHDTVVVVGSGKAQAMGGEIASSRTIVDGSEVITTIGGIVMTLRPSAVTISGSTYAFATPTEMVVDGETVSIGPNGIGMPRTTVSIPSSTSTATELQPTKQAGNSLKLLPPTRLLTVVYGTVLLVVMAG